MDELVTHETARLAKSKGYTIPTEKQFEKAIDNHYESWHDGYISFNSMIDHIRNERGERPTQTSIQRWLREKHWIEVSPYGEGRRTKNTLEYQCEVTDDRINKSTTIDGRFKSYEEALEEGIKYALTLINE